MSVVGFGIKKILRHVSSEDLWIRKGMVHTGMNGYVTCWFRECLHSGPLLDVLATILVGTALLLHEGLAARHQVWRLLGILVLHKLHLTDDLITLRDIVLVLRNLSGLDDARRHLNGALIVGLLHLLGDLSLLVYAGELSLRQVASIVDLLLQLLEPIVLFFVATRNLRLRELNRVGLGVLHLLQVSHKHLPRLALDVGAPNGLPEY